MDELVNAMHIIIQIPGELYIKELLEFTRPMTLRECMDFSEDHMEAVSTYDADINRWVMNNGSGYWFGSEGFKLIK